MAAMAAAVVLGSVSPAGAANRHRDGCVGTNATVGTDYTFTGTGYQQGASYIVQITVPNGSSFYPVATADRSGTWTETWLASLAGTYTAHVYAYQNWQYLGTCSLTAS